MLGSVPLTMCMQGFVLRDGPNIMLCLSYSILKDASHGEGGSLELPSTYDQREIEEAPHHIPIIKDTVTLSRA